MRTPRSVLIFAALALLASACTTAPQSSTASAQPPVGAAAVGELKFGSLTIYKGYLERQEYPDSLALLPPPPAQNSAALAADREAFDQLTALMNGPRGALAKQDANLHFPEAASTFSCALGIAISEQATPHLYTLLRRSATDAGLSTYKAKKHYQRTRPFVAFNAAICTPEEAEHLRKDGSYPSGHSALGWAWALQLAEIAPERADQVLQRGRAFAQSRGVCGVHWKSDIDAGRSIGAATVARLHANAVYRAQALLATDEVKAARAAGQLPNPATCASEAAALSTSAMLAP
ncbi:acid phosphatase [Ottowia sp.]|uniref:acid phosphatase n=1 Tax=Ottowia sp. TaxID=1898956 RepID=UPI003A8583D6